jgi:pimeloyl-ACP methyl ester carboxylesterase
MFQHGVSAPWLPGAVPVRATDDRPTRREDITVSNHIAIDSVASRDGTRIVYDRLGGGPPVILVGGTLTSRAAGVGNNAPLAARLADHFTVLNYDRRGRGESGGGPRPSLDREIEDLDALVAAAGGSAHLFGVSSGGALALEAAAAGVGADKVAVYEVPYGIVGDRARWRSYREELDRRLAEGRRGAALELFHRLTGFSEQDIAAARQSPMWTEAERLAHTLAQDAAVLGDGELPAARLASIGRPVLVATGGGAQIVEEAADAIAAGIPRAERVTLAGLAHAVDADALAPVLRRFFSG